MPKLIEIQAFEFYGGSFEDEFLECDQIMEIIEHFNSFPLRFSFMKVKISSLMKEIEFLKEASKITKRLDIFLEENED